MFAIIGVILFTTLLFLSGLRKITIWWYNQNLNNIIMELHNIENTYDYDWIVSDDNGNQGAISFDEAIRRGLFWEIREKQRLENIIKDINTMSFQQLYRMVMVNMRNCFYQKMKV